MISLDVEWWAAIPSPEVSRNVAMMGRGGAPPGMLRDVDAEEDDTGAETYRPILDTNGCEPRIAGECSEPGRYFVSVRRSDGAFRNVRGFFTWQCDALRALPGVRAEWAELDPRSVWYAWGTAREREAM